MNIFGQEEGERTSVISPMANYLDAILILRDIQPGVISWIALGRFDD